MCIKHDRPARSSSAARPDAHGQGSAGDHNADNKSSRKCKDESESRTDRQRDETGRTREGA